MRERKKTSPDSKTGASTAKDILMTDYVGILRQMRNKLRTVLTYNRKKAFKDMKTPQDFLNAVRKTGSEGGGGESAVDRAARLWFLERLIKEARIFTNGSFLLKNPAIERYMPILHVGWGMDVFTETGFDFSRFVGAVDTSINPKYRLLVMEPVGAVYVACRQPLKSYLFGMQTKPLPDQMSLASFFSRFSGEETQIMSHGFGRGTYFQVNTLHSALKKALHCPRFFNPFFVIRGIAFAYTMVNSLHLDEVYLTAERLALDNAAREEALNFRQGVISALSFLEWNFPGLLEKLKDWPITQKAMDLHKSYQARGGVYSF